MTKKTFKSKPPVGSKRHRIIDLAENLEAKYAVFRRSPSGRSAFFRICHESYDTAVEAARIHAAESVSVGDTDFTFYVIEVKCRLGIENGKLVDTTA
jgi:hypothetical protein